MTREVPLLEGILPVLAILTSVEGPLLRGRGAADVESTLDVATGDFAACVAAARRRVSAGGEMFEPALRQEADERDLDPLTLLFLDVFFMCARPSADLHTNGHLMRELRDIRAAAHDYTRKAA